MLSCPKSVVMLALEWWTGRIALFFTSVLLTSDHFRRFDTFCLNKLNTFVYKAGFNDTWKPKLVWWGYYVLWYCWDSPTDCWLVSLTGSVTLNTSSGSQLVRNYEKLKCNSKCKKIKVCTTCQMVFACVTWQKIANYFNQEYFINEVKKCC